MHLEETALSSESLEALRLLIFWPPCGMNPSQKKTMTSSLLEIFGCKVKNSYFLTFLSALWDESISEEDNDIKFA